MFFRYDISPERMRRLFASFRRHAARVDRVRRFHLTVALLLVPACSAVTAGLFLAPQLTGLTARGLAVYGMLLMAGVGFLAVGWGVSSLLAGIRHPLGLMGGPVVPLILGLPLILIAVMAFPKPSLASASAADVWIPWVLATLAVMVLSRFIFWVRLADAKVDPVELGHLTSTIEPLLCDLPPNAVCSLVCNPYPARWTATMEVVKLGGRTLGVFDDVLLDFRAELPERTRLVLRTLHRRIDKYKNRKQKFKGSKHVVTQSFRLEQPGAGPLDERAAEAFDALAGRIAVASPTRVTQHAHDAVDDGLRLWVRHKHKFPHVGPLLPSHLPAPDRTLATISELSRFVAGLGR